MPGDVGRGWRCWRDWTLAAVAVLATSAAADPPDRPLTLGVISDPHISTDPEQVVHTLHFVEAIERANEHELDAVLLPGDLTTHGFASAAPRYAAIAGRLRAPAFAVPGNHDVGNKPMPDRPSHLSQARVDAYHQELGPSWYTTRLRPDVRLIGINSLLLGTGLADEPRQWAFLERELSQPTDAYTIVMMHVPPYVNEPDEPAEYFNLDPAPRERLMGLLRQGGVDLVITGHLHRPIQHTVDDMSIVSVPPTSFGLPRGKQPETWSTVRVSTAGEVTVEHHDLAADAPSSGETSERVQVFYYPWYGTPGRDGAWVHWQQGGHEPPTSIGADFEPVLGPYSSADERVIRQHMRWIREAGAGVLIYSWWGPGSREDQLLDAVIAAAARRAGLAVAIHIEPYPNRTPETVARDVKSLVDRFGGERALWRCDSRPVFYVYRALDHSAEQWRKALQWTSGGARPLLLAQTTDLRFVTAGGFDGGYNYDIVPWFREGAEFGEALERTATAFEAAGKLFVPCIGPGYLDDAAAPEGVTEPGGAATRDGGTADTYRQAWTVVTRLDPPWVAITSFNEWHEGTQIEPAFNCPTPESGAASPWTYLDLTRQLAEPWLAK